MTFLPTNYTDGNALDASDVNAITAAINAIPTPASLLPVAVTAAGTNQGTATALTGLYSVATSVASGTGVLLQPLVPQTVLNAGLNTLLVYPPVGAQIGSAGTNVAYSLAVGAGTQFLPTSTTQFYTFAQITQATLTSVIANLGTTEPGSAGVMWVNGGVVQLS